MHLIPDGNAQIPLRRWRAERLKAKVVDLISRFANYEGPGDTPDVTVELLRQGNVGVALSVLYGPFDEIDLEVEYASKPKPGYFQHLLDQIATVEQEVATHDNATIAHNAAELQQALDTDTTALIHAIEGGFALGATPHEIEQNIATLAAKGVAYITLAHLFWRRVATNAPALPFLPDWLYRTLFPQPQDEGLSELGAAAARAMLEHRILIDVTHMSATSLKQTLDLLDERDPEQTIPVIASHGAVRLHKLAYNLDDDSIKRIAGRNGVIGLIACTHYIADGRKEPKTLDDSLRLLSAHIDHIADVTGSHDHVAIGSDHDGYIKPALPGLKHAGTLQQLQDHISDTYGEHAEQILNGNARRVLRYRFPA